MSTPERRFDLISIGRAAVDLYGEQIGGPLEDMTSFAKYLGGCAANIAVGAARLGLRVAMLTRVGDEHMGRFVRASLAGEGIDVSHVTTDPQHLTGLVILGIQDEATFPLIFYRENCADMALSVEDIDPDFIASAGALLVTGTHFSQPGVAAACRRAIDIARAAGARVVLDIDYRPVLWGLTSRGLGEQRFVASPEVTRHLQAILPLVDVIVGTEEELHIAGGSTDTLEAVQCVRRLSDAVIVVKRGAEGCAIFEGEIGRRLEDAVSVPGFRIEVFNVLGAGDGFMAGLLSGLLRGRPAAEAGRIANACGALVVARHGCAPAMPSAEELADFLDRHETIRRPHEDVRIAAIHRLTTGRAVPSVCALAFDHRRQFEDMAAAAGAGEERIRAFKTILAEAVLELPAEQSGAIVDDRFGREALRHLTGTGRWIARPVEQPGSRPLEFAFSGEVALELRSWPAEHVAKCLVSYDAEDTAELRVIQENSLRALQEACHATSRGLLIEVIPERWQDEPARVAAAVGALARAGLAPDWWKLPPLATSSDWQAVVRATTRTQGPCRGIIVLGLDRPGEELARSFAAAAGEPAICGFAIGRSVFRPAAEGFLAGMLDAASARRLVRERFEAIRRAWARRGEGRGALREAQVAERPALSAGRPLA